ncbi:hypothetical protein BGW36DRAFT_425219 [Talaromyces proteolyticus]|uniref:Nucleoside phosphorylase domain-containing protein n=1 Tax=Talaromyces proteolyticus TaxID=1131652 RepID=A0AAD4KT27_9EURO|nr:uncharacterized protein BGW36DRAFT_425219 [Talaromyces proteolyticus]KAH8700392.1 hypothetical protein BGW36DRAFT_425219 [Talaromyces proteolyticus]
MTNAQKRKLWEIVNINSNASHPSHEQKRRRELDTPETQDSPIDQQYTIGLICALQCEYDALCRMLCEEFDNPEGVDISDNNTYVFGRIESHHVVIGCLPTGRQGNNTAARVARDMVRSFPNLRFALLVGIGAAAPTARNDIRLGDVVVSVPNGRSSGVVKYDLGKRLSGNRFELTSQLNAPPEILLGLLTEIRRRHKDPTKKDVIMEHMKRMDDMSDYRRPAIDILYAADHDHQGRVAGKCDQTCGTEARIIRPQRQGSRQLEIHYGTIASGDSVIKDPAFRDQLSADPNYNILCFEMEAAGLMNNFPCLVIRGISDYADSHKNDDWQNYAALAAAAFSRHLLTLLKPSKVVVMDRWFSRIETNIRNIHNEVKQLRSHIEQDKLFHWLRPTDASQNYTRAIETRQPGTSTWVLEHEKFLRWKSKKGSFLWISGIAGSGKTILASSIIEHIAQLTPACNAMSSMTALIYFYFDFSDCQKQTHRSMINSFIWQISSQASQPSPVLNQVFHLCHDGHIEPSTRQLYEILHDFLESFTDVYIVIDAQDETTDPAKTLHFISSVFDRGKDKVHILVTSRGENELNTYLKHLSNDWSRLGLKKQPINRDIAHYIRHRLQSDPELERWRKMPGLRLSIERGILTKSDGMFRLAVCHLDDLKQNLNVEMLKRTLNSLPQSLEETYTKIISSIDTSHKRYTLQVLQWLVYAKRPPSIAELVEVLAVDTEKKEQRPFFDIKNRFPNPHDILKICSNLIVVEADVWDHPGSEKVKLSHASVRDYLVSEEFKARFGDIMQADNANAEIASVCLGYLLELENVESSTLNEKGDISLPLMSYATRYWYHHARCAPEGIKTMNLLTVDFFLNKKRAFTNWVRLYEVSRSPQLPYPEATDALYYASLTGTEECVKLLLEKGHSPNEFASNGETPLEPAVQGGFENIVVTLLQHGANPDFLPLYKSHSSMAPLKIAVQNGHTSIVRHLLDAGADPNIRQPGHDITASALEIAILTKRTNIVELLLEYGANPNTALIHKNNQYALQLLSREGNLPLVRLLLEKGANPCGGDYKNYHPTPLEEALYNGDKQIAKLLLDHGAMRRGSNRINILDNLDEDGFEKVKSYLETNSYHGNYDLIELLLDSSLGSSEKYRDLHGVALWMAASQGHVRVVALLVDRCRVIPRKFVVLARQWTPETCQDQIFSLLDRVDECIY